METPQMNINQILFVLGLRSDWGLYMHNLIELARETNSSIHLLETGAPLGTGSFTSTAVMDTTQEVQTPYRCYQVRRAGTSEGRRLRSNADRQ